MKSNLLKSFFISLILLVGATNAWAYNQSAVDLYFDNSEAKWSSCYVYIGHSTWTSCYPLTRVSGTQYLWKLAKADFNSGSAWNGATGWVLCNEKWWDSNGESIDKYTWHGAKNVTKKRTSAWSASYIYKTNGTVSVTSDGNTINAYNTTTVSKSNYTVTINTATGGTLTVKDYDNNAVSSGASKIYLTVLKFSASASTGYTFGGVEINNGSTTTTISAADIASKTYTLTSNVTITPIWTPNTYNITYKDQGDVAFSGTHASGYPTTHTYGTATTLKSPTKNNYTFGGWFTSSNCSGSAISSLSATGYTADITLYAKWTINTHTVSYGVCSSTRWGSIKLNSETAITTTGTKTLNHGTAISFTATPDTGYQVVGWYSNADCTTQLQAGGNSYNAGTLTANKTVYVKFEQIPATSHNITYTTQGTGWTYDANNPTSAEEGEKVSFTVTPATGYSVTVKSDVDLEKNGNTYTFEMPSKDVEIDVTATEILSTITIFATPEEAGNVLVNGQPFTAGGTVKVGIATSVEVTAVPNDGYGVAAWSRTEGVVNHLSGSNPITITTYGTGADGVLRANFIGLEYTITFDKQEGTNGTDKATVRYKNNNYSVSPVVAPTRAGYTFGGYYTQAAGAGVQVVSAEGQWLANATDYTDADRKWLVKENTTLYAKWVELPPTTIYVKTDGNCTDLKWNSTGMETLDCEGIYYTANIPASVSEITITGSNNFTTTALTVPTDDNILYDISQNLIYLTPNSNWTQASARFAAAFLNSNKSTTEWVSMTSVGNGIYNCAIPDGSWKYVIFCRMNPSAAANNWDNKWNQTEDLEIPTDAKNLYTVKSGTWDKGGGSWSAHYDNSCWTAYSAPTYTINTESGEGGTIEISPSSPVALNEQITVTMIPEDGYSFLSGTITMGNQTPVTITEVSSTYTICGPTTITAEFESNTRTVTFDANGHGTTPEKQTINSGEKATEPAPLTEEGYTFGGWYTEKECTTQFDFNTEITENTTLYAKWTEIKHTVTISAGENGSVDPSGERQIGIVGIDVTATPTDATRFRFAKWEVTGGAQIVDATSATTRITATAEGTVTAHFEELQPKTIYLKTVEGTEDGVTWYVRYNSTETLMAPLGCTGEFYTAEVPEQTEFQLIATDQNGDVIAKETRDGLVIPNDDKNLFNLVAAGASGDKIFFKPNSHWKNHSTHKYFVARFWTGSAVIKDLVDPDGDGIYECEMPAGAIEVYFCLTKAQASASSGKDWPSDDVAHTNDNVKEGFKDGKNLFTLGDDQTVGGENDNGTWSTHADTPVNGEGAWEVFEGITYRITFDQTGATDGETTNGTEYVDAQYRAAMPTIESLPKNTNWKFGGYYTEKNGGGNAITNAFGDWLDADGYISDGKWAKEACVTLYAHWVEKTPEITVVTLDKEAFDAGTAETVTATPTVQEYPSYTGDYTICWKMLDNSGTVMESFPFTPGDNNSVTFSTDGLTTGIYIVRASIYDTDCDTGNELSRYDKTFTIVSGYKVTVKYLCDGEVIQASSIVEGHASNATEITAPEIGGYKFVNWELGDGIFSESDLNSQTISYTAIYDGYLTAKYEKKKLIFLDLSNQFGETEWTEPHIYLYSGSYWDNTNGTGGTHANCIANGAMTRVGTSNIWYYDYESVKNFNGYVAFTPTDQSTLTRFKDTEAIYRYDFSSGTPVFVPAQGQKPHLANQVNGTKAQYYNKGHWTKYMGGTGYTLKIYNKKEDGRTEVMSVPFTGSSLYLPFTAIADLEEGKTYGYKIVRDNDKWYKNDADGTMTVDNHENWPFIEDNSNGYACGIQTVATGDHTFTLTLNATTGNLEVSVDYPAKVGNYRILYTDDVRDGRYKPSQIISQNNEKPLVSFFIRPNDNPELKIQKATLVTENEVKWDYNNFIYLKPNSNWKADGARFAAAFLNSDKTQTVWVSMTSIEENTTYGCAIPNGTWKYVIFCRMNGNTSTNNWENKWDQTNDLDIPTNGNNLYTIANDAWNYGGGSWSKFTNNNSNIIDLSDQLEEKLAELDLTNIKENEGSVFNIHLSNNEGTLTIDSVAFYTGNYYIRVDAVDGKWYDYKTNPDNLMTYSAFSESKENSFGEKFSHYKTKWCEQGTNVKFVIANDYSLCISDTLTQDEGNPFSNIDEHGNINNDGKYNANIRFMWNRHTNKVSRAYVAAASDEARKFLVLKANKTIQNESGQAINNNEVVFKDTQNWLYERTIKVQPGTLVKLYACYPDLDEANAQHFRGKYSNDFTEGETAVQILGGTNTEWYTMRIIYDFKTNRLMGAWIPDQNINGTLEIDADIMVIRQHQEDATYITFAKNGGQLTEVKTVYGVMRFNRWTLNNRSTSNHNVLPVQDQKSIYERALYFISFPFDVHLSDVFGFGTYGTHWVISEYNGLRRAQNGYFVDNCINEDCTNWDYIWDPSNFTMKANQGYLLSLDLDLMKHDNTSFWAHDIQQVELFFPSFAHVQTIKQTSYTMPALTKDYKCTINFNKVEPGENGYNPVNDHRVRDSYWRCIGVPSFADYNNTLTDGTNEITWNPKGSDLPFLYEWNVSDNSLMVRAAKNYKFRSTFAYLIQNGNPIYWSAVNTKPSNIVARRQAADEVKNYEWKLTLSRNEQIEDQAFVRLSNDEQVTTEFDFNQDLSKEFNYGRSDIYTLIGYEKAAANSLPLSEQTTLIPLGLSIEYNGDYTIAMPDGTANIGVTLIDTESNTRTNLSAGMEYTLTLKKGDYNNRFFIEISPIQQTPTDIEYVENSHDDQARKVLIDNILYIVRDGQIFDARGARVK